MVMCGAEQGQVSRVTMERGQKSPRFSDGSEAGSAVGAASAFDYLRGPAGVGFHTARGKQTRVRTASGRRWAALDARATGWTAVSCQLYGRPAR